ncbi:hypothetical protein KY284_029014 [Solanum tuberosum]|nr:hypothetical protein KY284_029014 [Solanum tuberosum]
MGTTGYAGLSFTLVSDFTAFVHPTWNVLRFMDNDTHEAKFYKKIGLPLCKMFYDLLAKIAWSLKLLGSGDKKGDVLIVPWWSLYLDILKGLQNISKLYKDMENDFWQIMRQVKVSLCILITKFAEESEHYEWLFKHKEVTNFYKWRKLAMMMLLEVEDNEQDQYYMLIDRSKFLVDSFEYIAKLKNIPGSFFVEFKEEQAIGLGVLREWFLLASQEIFNPNNALFASGRRSALEVNSRSKCFASGVRVEIRGWVLRHVLNSSPEFVVGVEYQGQITIHKLDPRLAVRVGSHIRCQGQILVSMSGFRLGVGAGS